MPPDSGKPAPDGGAAVGADERVLYFVIRIPKSGSVTLQALVRDGLPDAHVFDLPPLPPREGTARERVWFAYKTAKRMLLNIGTPGHESALRKIARTAQPGDVVAGHLDYGSIAVPGWRLAPITLIRHPLARLISHYNYTRAGYLKRGPWRRRRVVEDQRLTGTLGLDDYVAELWRQRDRLGWVGPKPAVAMLFGGAEVDDPVDFLDRAYFHYGLLERLDLFRDGFARKLGRPIEAAWKNRTGRNSEMQLSPRALALAEQLYADDLRLYDRLLQRVEAGA